MLFYFFLTVSLFADGIELSDAQKEYLKTKQNITMCVDPDWEPFEKIVLTPKSALHVGISADIIQLVAKRLNIKIELVPTATWDETLDFSQHKKCDILSFVNQTPQRDKWLIFTDPIFTDPNVLVARQEQEMIDDLSKERLSIAFPKGTAMYERFSKDYPNLVFIPTLTEAEAFTLVEEKKADLTLRSLIITAYTIKKEGLFNLKIVGKPKGYGNILRMGVLKEEVILRDILNLGIGTLSKEDVDTIVNKHVQIVIEEVHYYTIGFTLFFALMFVMFLVVTWNYTLRQAIKKALEKNSIQSHLLFEKTKQAELATIVGNISHQLRDSLSKISYINLSLMSKIKSQQNIPTQALDEATREIDASIEFMSETMHAFLDFYRSSSKLTHFNIFESIQETLLILDTKLKENDVKIEFDIKHNLSLEGAKNEWMQVWLNLLNNTIHQGIEKKINKIVLTISIDENLILFEDNCLGVCARILEQFANCTNEGVGLKMCHDILEKYDWNMKITNTQKGARVSLYR